MGLSLKVTELYGKNIEGEWTLFWDMHSGGGSAWHFDKIFVQGGEYEARELFEDVTGCNPDNVSCSCCGSDYSVMDSEDLYQSSGYHRRCKMSKDAGGYIEAPAYPDADDDSWSKYLTLEEYVEQDDVVLIFKDGSMNKMIEKGYMW